MKKYIVIVAGGKGKRMEEEQPKQFLEIGTLPILMRTFHAFSFLADTAEFILVLPTDSIDYWKQLCQKYSFTLPHQIAEAGPKRFHSVKSALKFIPDGVLLAIHDAVRPFVSKQIIEDCFTMAERKGNAVPVTAVDESIRELSGTLNKTINRNKLRLVQTPQVFQSSIIKRAYQQPYNEIFTDDATVLENLGKQIFLVDGERKNIKITNQVDLLLAQAIIDSNTDFLS